MAYCRPRMQAQQTPTHWDFFEPVSSSGRGVPPPPSTNRLELLCPCFPACDARIEPTTFPTDPQHTSLQHARNNYDPLTSSTLNHDSLPAVGEELPTNGQHTATDTNRLQFE